VVLFKTYKKTKKKKGPEVQAHPLSNQQKKEKKERGEGIPKFSGVVKNTNRDSQSDLNGDPTMGGGESVRKKGGVGQQVRERKHDNAGLRLTMRGEGNWGQGEGGGKAVVDPALACPVEKSRCKKKKIKKTKKSGKKEKKKEKGGNLGGDGGDECLVKIIIPRGGRLAKRRKRKKKPKDN